MIGFDASEHIRKNFSDKELEYLRSKIFYITGGSGFVGRWIIATLLHLFNNENTPEIVIITRTPKKVQNLFPAKKSVKVIDWTEMMLSPHYESSTKEVIGFHCAVPAASGEVIGADQVKFFGENTRKFISKIIEISDSPTLINISTGGVYDRPTSGLIGEQSIRKHVVPFTNYETTKINDEVILENLAKAKNVNGANPRLFSFCGPGLELPGTFAVSNFIHLAKAGKPIKIIGNPHSLRSYMSPLDMAIWILKSSIYPTLETLHIGSSEVFTIEKIAEIISKKFGTRLEIDSSTSEIPIRNYVPVIQNTFKHLRITQTLDFQSSLNYWVDNLSTTMQFRI